jgi:hypothetical protein
MAEGNLTKLAELARRLLERTRDGKLRWERTDKPGYFTAVLSGGSVAVQQLSGTMYQLLVLDAEGVELEKVQASSDELTRMSAFTTPTEDERALDKTVPVLYDLARRQALNIDQALDSLLDELG